MSALKKTATTSAPIHSLIGERWSPRAFADRPVEPEKLRSLFEAARWAASSYNGQPWNFIVVKDAEIKRKFREAAEAEERESYEHRMPADWLEALAPLGTDWVRNS